MKNNVVLAIAFLATACVHATHSSASRSPHDLDAGVLLNARYELPEAAHSIVSVHDGKWNLEDAEGRRSLTVMDLNLRGDLNGDGADDAVMLLVYWGGGSGVFSYLAAVLNDKGQPRHVSSVELGDRVKIKSVRLKRGKITARLVVTGERDAACCPTERITLVFALVNGELVEKKDA
jgi:hypothetical protein